MTSLLDKDPEFPKLRGLRTDGRNLVNAWLNNHADAGHTDFYYVWNQTDFDAIDTTNINHLLGRDFRTLKI